MKNKEIEKQVGKIVQEEETPNGTVIYTSDRKYFIAKRDPVLSDSLAIKEISRYGIAPVIFVGDSYILEGYVEFSGRGLKLEDCGNLLSSIHMNKFEGKSLVHGDFGSSNTTDSDGNPKCFDYEFTHFGDVYRDLGRVILRNCNSPEEMIYFFESYSGKIPSLEELIEGLCSFCDWQNLMRKNSEFQEIPLIRKRQVKSSKKNIKAIFNSFKEVGG